MNTSVVVVAEPAGVATVIGPDDVPSGAVVVRLVDDAADTAAKVRFTLTRSLPATVSKFVPVIVRAPPGATIVGEKPATVGAPADGDVTVHVSALVALPPVVLTPSGEVVAPAGTTTVS